MTDAAILVVDKAVGPTSHDVVDVVRRITGTRRVGHAGTLDPLASGVLVILIEAATRLAEYLTGHAKRYRAVVKLGATTATDDAEGPILVERPVNVGRDELIAALAEFRGPIQQRPPAFAAVKLGGERSYVKARRGETVQHVPRPVTILALELVEFALPLVTLDVHCSAGTYVRSLARDLGERLGCGGHLTELRRTASGPFEVAKAVALDRLTPEQWRDHALPLEVGLADWPRIDLSADDERRLRSGQAVPVATRGANAELWRAHDASGRLIAVVRFDSEHGAVAPVKVL